MEIAKTQIKVKTRDLKTLKSELTNLLNYKGVKLAIVANRNIKLIDEITNPIDEAYSKTLKNIDKYEDYQKATYALYEKYAARGEDGKIIYNRNENGTLITINHTEQYNAEEESLKNEYKDTIEAIEAARKELEEALEEDNDIVFNLIDSDYINDEVTGNEIKNLIAYEIIR